MTVKLVAGRLSAALDTISHASFDNEARPILASILFEGDETGFRLVAADNYRMGVAELEVLEDSDTQGFGRAVVSRDDVPGIRWLLKLAKRHKGTPVPVSISRATGSDGEPDLITFSVLSTVITVQAINGVYPNYQEVLAGAIAKGNRTFAFNPRFLGEAGKALRGSPIVEVLVSDPLSPIVITADSGDGERYRELIMPVRTVVSRDRPAPAAPNAEAVA